MARDDALEEGDLDGEDVHLGGAGASYDVKVLLGKRDNEMDLVFARQVAEVFNTTGGPAAGTAEAAPTANTKPRPLLIALTLKNPTTEDLTTILGDLQATVQQQQQQGGRL